MRELDFDIVSGDSKAITVRVLSSEGQVINLTGATVIWRLFTSNDSTSFLLSKEQENGIIVEAPAQGIFTINITPQDTASLEGIFYHEVQVTELDGTVTTAFNGIVTIIRGLI